MSKESISMPRQPDGEELASALIYTIELSGTRATGSDMSASIAKFFSRTLISPRA